MKAIITSHLEDYLKAILFVSSGNGNAHASAVAEKMGVTRASVTGALRALADRSLIAYRPYQPVVLTDEGRQVAQACASRHQFLHQFFRDQLGMADLEAESVASKVEHVASSSVLSRMAEFTRFLAECREVELVWDSNGTLRCTRKPISPRCRGCVRKPAAVSD